MIIYFSKMHGLGNDFMVIDGVTQIIQLSSPHIRQLSDRHTGIGFDQLLLIEKPLQPGYDFAYRIFNADGSEVAQCGNGARCAARFIQLKQLSTKTKLLLQTENSILETELLDDNSVQVNMGAPRFLPHDIPFQVLDSQKSKHSLYTLQINKQTIQVNVLSMGNPHAVLLVDNIASAPVKELGLALQQSAYFPEQVNVGFMQVLNQHSIALRVFERGAGETQACGSGACAAVVAGISRGLLSNQVQVKLPGGDLQINWAGDNAPVFLAGPAVFIFDGTVSESCT